MDDAEDAAADAAGERYIIAPARPGEPDRTLDQVRAHLGRDPEASIVRDRPERLVAAMAPAAVDRLRATFAAQLIIEPDSDLLY